MSGITEPGALGISVSPSAVLSKSTELAIDGGANFYEANSGRTLNSANGRYTMRAHRAGLTLIARR